jgi:hypothetical protein
MDYSAQLSRSLTADEVAELVPTGGEAESPTTGLIDLKSQSTAEAHIPGIVASAKAAGDTVPDPKPLKEK